MGFDKVMSLGLVMNDMMSMKLIEGYNSLRFNDEYNMYEYVKVVWFSSRRHQGISPQTNHC